MPVLKSLSFTVLPKTGYDPVQIRPRQLRGQAGGAEAAPEGPKPRPDGLSALAPAQRAGAQRLCAMTLC
jgi:hypothetical protein